MDRFTGAWTPALVITGLIGFFRLSRSASCSRARRGRSRSMAAGWAELRPMQTPRPEAQGAPLRQHPRDSRILMRAIWLLDGLQVLQTGSLGAVPSNWLI